MRAVRDACGYVVAQEFYPSLGWRNEPISGIDVYIKPDGKIDVEASEVIRMKDGRELLLQSDGSWISTPPNDITEVQSIDLAVYPENYTGRRIRVLNVILWNVNVQISLVTLPGRSAYMKTSRMNRDMLKQLILACGGVAASGCHFNVAATVALDQSQGIWLIDPVVTPAD